VRNTSSSLGKNFRTYDEVPGSRRLLITLHATRVVDDDDDDEGDTAAAAVTGTVRNAIRTLLYDP